MDNVDTFVDNVDNFVGMWVKFDILGRKLADEAKSEVGIHNFCSPCGMLIGVL